MKIIRCLKTDYAGKYSRGTTRTVTRNMSAQLSRCYKICKRKMRHPQEQTIQCKSRGYFYFWFFVQAVCFFYHSLLSQLVLTLRLRYRKDLVRSSVLPDPLE